VKSRHCAATNARRVASAAGGVALAVGTLLLVGAVPAQAQTSANTASGRPVSTASSSAPGAKAKRPAAGSDAKSAASYSLGVSFGTQLHGQYGINADALVYERVIQGLKDALAGKAVAGPEDSQRIQAMIAGVRATEGSANRAAAEKFLADNGKLPGVITTPSGLEYKVIRPGSGELPKVTDTVTVNYRGTLLDGTEFDSSYKPGRTPFTTPLTASLIKGWTEALMLMKPGSKIELYIPPALAYGTQSPPPIPPDSLLKFEVELLSVKPTAAASSAPMSNAVAPKHP
jgi:FKBP-type peptidyl-prolyl cis-trans isomerase FkpA